MSAESGRRLWLVRHGETEGQSSVRYYGATDIPLSALGAEQIAALAPRLAQEQFAALFHSPLSRAVKSAQIILDQLVTPPEQVSIDEVLRETDFGEFEGMTAEEIQESQPEWFATWRAGQAERYPGGDSLEGFAQRAGQGVRSLVKSVDGDVCVVAHRGVVKAALAQLLELPRAKVRSWPLDLASATVLIDTGSGGWALDRYNLIGEPPPGP